LVIKTLIEDINQLSNASNEAGKEGSEELCIWALRTVASLCGASIKLQQFFKKHKREIEVCTYTCHTCVLCLYSNTLFLFFKFSFAFLLLLYISSGMCKLSG